jgi:hypothetical protein
VGNRPEEVRTVIFLLYRICLDKNSEESDSTLVASHLIRATYVWFCLAHNLHLSRLKFMALLFTRRTSFP